MWMSAIHKKKNAVCSTLLIISYTFLLSFCKLLVFTVLLAQLGIK